MADVKKEKSKSPQEDVKEILPDGEEVLELEEVEEDGEDVKDGSQADDLRRKLENMELSEELAGKASAQAKNLKTLQDEKKLEELLKIAGLKGPVYAVRVAKKLQDAYILDRLHDLLIEKGYHKNPPK